MEIHLELILLFLLCRFLILHFCIHLGMEVRDTCACVRMYACVCVRVRARADVCVCVVCVCTRVRVWFLILHYCIHLGMEVRDTCVCVRMP